MSFTKFLVGAGVSLITLATAASAEITMRYSNWLPATHPFNAEVITPWIEDVERVTEGRVKIQVLPKVVGTVPTQFEVVRDGLADVSLIIDGYSPGRFNLGAIVELPFVGNDARSMGMAYWRLLNSTLLKFGEFENVVPVGVGVVGASALTTVPGPITSVAEMKGMKLRVPTATGSKVVAALGAVPVNKPISEMYELISTGVVDGMVSSTETIKSFKLQDAVKNVTVVKGGFGSAAISFIVNGDTLAELSEEDQKAFWSVSGEVFTQKISNVYARMNKDGMALLEQSGGKITYASPAFEADLRTALSGVDQAWIEKAESLGLKNAAQVLADFRAEIAEMEKDLGDN
ncbi:TRAP-type C4-dicarboxylate transport system, substrate-binding protein [Thalassovita litoralis]|jgi:TRAP-type C4-dicarboxylate transport system substrate-binding protein|uniref:TRAP-type C4-dicarboxylate transport system, substrate-binding protein n=1 Tax=Thalassovita litoralis TaxID=1010611 RepID=A0A521C5H5_9RHOB|nr:TRAP transporter substrate-binding protein [Thalassovita litoralis]SMO54605.1 TRAP-type C4-dicarboxylate transport system, substrate-binding protein [Thalassovita litoralis]